MDDYKARMAEEYDDLMGRICKLETWLEDHPDIDGVDGCPRYLACKQLDAMMEYANVLYARMVVLGVSH